MEGGQGLLEPPEQGQELNQRGEAQELLQQTLNLTRSTVFFLLVSARGPDTNASHRSCCSAGSSAHMGMERM
jgi:hypothetical protein